MRIDPNAIKRFWDKVDRRSNEECWPWMAGLTHGGYGHFRVNSSVTGKMGSHRFSLCLKLSRILRSNEFACHSCDNPKCCNPEHLYLGSAAENMADKMKKGRWKGGAPKGVITHNSKMNFEKAAQVRVLLEKHTVKEIADMFQVDRGTISDIKTNKTWFNESATQ